MATGILNLLTAAILAWGYQPAGDFADPGPCHSAARIGDSFILGCRLGVWQGRQNHLRLAVPCLVRDEQPNRVRVFGEKNFIASTPCGLFLVDPRGMVERIPFFTQPGALDADHLGQAVVENRGEIWLLDAGLGTTLVAHMAEDVPHRLQLAGDILLIEGERRRALELRSKARHELPGWGRLAFFGAGRQLLVHPSGRYWTGAAGSPLDQSRRLPLGHGERVTGVVGLDRRALVLTSTGLILLQDQDLSRGRLPPVAGAPVPVRGSRTDEPPWMVVGNTLFRPVADDSAPAGHRLGEMLQEAIDRQGLELPGCDACSSAWLPRLQISAFGGQSRVLTQAAENHWRFSRAWNVGIMVELAWSLDRPLTCLADSQRSQLLRDIRKERRELEERLAGLLEIHRQHCLRKDRWGTEETAALLEVLTGQEFSCRIEWYR